jgi:hypothetical protein
MTEKSPTDFKAVENNIELYIKDICRIKQQSANTLQAIWVLGLI